MMKSLVKRGVSVLALGAAALVLSAGQAFAVPMQMVMDTATDQDGSVYLFNGPGGVDSDYGLRFDLSGDANWGNFQSALSGISPSYTITSAIFHIWITPATSIFSDRHRLFDTAGYVGDNSDLKLTPINGGGIGLQVVRLNQELGIVNYTVGEPLDYEFDLVDWYSTDDLKDLILNNNGIVNLGSADDSFVHMGKLTVTVTPNPEPATLFLFGSGLVGLAAWRLRKNSPQV